MQIIIWESFGVKRMILNSKHDIGEQKFLDAAGFICGYFLTPKSKQRMLNQAGTSFIVPPCIMCVQYRGSAQYRGGVQYHGGIS